jgi:hypothetical protein
MKLQDSYRSRDIHQFLGQCCIESRGDETQFVLKSTLTEIVLGYPSATF